MSNNPARLFLLSDYFSYRSAAENHDGVWRLLPQRADAKPPPPPSPMSPHLWWPKCNVLPIQAEVSTGGQYQYELSQRHLILYAAPKAGATLTSRLAIALAGKTQAAMAYGGYPLHYAHEMLHVGCKG